jgi:hypothetical protein
MIQQMFVLALCRREIEAEENVDYKAGTSAH